MDFYKAYHFLKRHEKGYFMDALDIEMVKVNPAKNEIDDDRSRTRMFGFGWKLAPKWVPTIMHWTAVEIPSKKQLSGWQNSSGFITTKITGMTAMI